jgi:two-component system, NarL family, response regulator NreC
MKRKQMIKVLLAEDLALNRTAYRALLETTGEVEVIGEAATGREAVRLARKLKPDVIMMDVVMPELNGIEAARQIHAAQPDVHILMVSMYAERHYIFESLRAGALGYVPKQAALSELMSGIRAVHAGGTYLSPPLSGLVMDDYVRRARGKDDTSELAKLSPRERQVLQLIAEGHSSAAIARTLHISTRTVDTHRHNLMEKLGIHSVAELTRFAIRNGVSAM